MRIIITINNETHIINLYNFQYWNQRWFALGSSLDGSIFKKFITTKGFDRILIESTNGIQFNFKKEHFSPYLCNKEKDIWRESQLINNNKDIVINDVGPSNYSGKYEYIDNQEGLAYKDDMYFETKTFTAPEFDLLKYQNDDFYYTRENSIHKNGLPQLTNITNIDLFGKINIIHGVSDNGKDYFDCCSLNQICDVDLGFSETNAVYLLLKSISQHKKISIPNCRLPYIVYGKNNFYLYDQEFIRLLKSDCGDTYIKYNIIKKIARRKYALRYLYDYFNFVHRIMDKRRKTSIPIITGAKEFKKEDFVVHFNNDTGSEFKIVYYKDIFSIDKKMSLNSYVNGEPQYMITGRHDYTDSKIKYDHFDTNADLLKYVRSSIGVAQSIHLARVISTWLVPNQGYHPRIIKLKMSPKANSKAISNSMSLYSVPLYDDNELYDDSVYISLYDLFANFGIHIPQVRNIVNMNEFADVLYRSLQYKFPVYHISHDYRRPLFNWEMDTQLNNCMTDLRSAIHLIRLFSSMGPFKNSYWHSNANQILMAFPNMTKPDAYGKLDFDVLPTAKAGGFP